MIAVLQNIDIIAAKHRLPGKESAELLRRDRRRRQGAHLGRDRGQPLPRARGLAPRARRGKPTRPVLFRALGIILVCAIPVLLIFAVAAKPLLKIAFGANRTAASDSLIVLGARVHDARGTYLAIQYMLALQRTWFLIADRRSSPSPSRSCC